MTSLEGRDIVCLSTHYWDERRFRKQEFMDRFRRRNRVLYVEPSFSMARQAEPHLRSAAQNSVGRSHLLERDDGFWTLQPPRGLPYWSKPAISNANYRWFAASIRLQMRKLGFADPVLWVYQPGYAPALGLIPHHRLVFDLVDDLAGYLGASGRAVEAAESRVRTLVSASDLLVVTSPLLLDTYGPSARRTLWVPNGYDAPSFLAPGRLEPPSELADIKVPILGLVGTLFSFLDFDLLREIARRNRDKVIVMIGPVEGAVRDEVDLLVKEPNVRHVPPVARSEIPRYIERFSLCLNVFKAGRVADNVSPLKVYEYLAMGKPVVSTPMAGLQREDVARVIAFADGPEDYCRQIDACLAMGREAAEERRSAVQAHSWDRLFEQLDSTCAEAL